MGLSLKPTRGRDLATWSPSPLQRKIAGIHAWPPAAIALPAHLRAEFQVIRRVIIPQTNPGDDAIIPEMRRVWQEAVAFFAFAADRPPIAVDDDGRRFAIAIDARPALRSAESFARTVSMTEEDLFGCHVDLTLSPLDGYDSPSNRLWRGVLEQLFLAINISAPGSLNLSNCWYFPSTRDATISLSDRPPQLGSEGIYWAYRTAIELWPQYVFLQVPFSDVWRWLHDDIAYGATVARTPFQRAVFALLRVCHRERSDPDNYLTCVTAIEGLLVGRPSKSGELRRRIEEVVGFPPEKDWFRDFYRRRSEIAHGSYDVVRPDLRHGELRGEPDSLANELQEPMDLALAVLLAVLQRSVAGEQ